MLVYRLFWVKSSCICCVSVFRACIYLLGHKASQHFPVFLFKPVQSPSHQPAWETQMFGGCELKLPLIFLCAAKNGKASDGFLFLDYTCKVIQNIGWGEGARWPRLLLPFTNFVSAKWTWLRGRPDYITRPESFINETHDPRDSGSLVPTSHFVCVCVRQRWSLWQYYRELLWWFHSIWYNASILTDEAALF